MQDVIALAGHCLLFDQVAEVAIVGDAHPHYQIGGPLGLLRVLQQLFAVVSGKIDKSRQILGELGGVVIHVTDPSHDPVGCILERLQAED